MRETSPSSAPSSSSTKGAAELSQALAAFLSQYNENASNGATASVRHVAEAYGATSEPVEDVAAPAASSPSTIDSALDDLQADFDSLIYNLRSVSARQADPSRPMASSYTMPGAKSDDSVTQIKAGVADFVGGLMKVTLALGQNGTAPSSASGQTQPATAPAASPAIKVPEADAAAETVKVPQATILYTPEAAKPAGAPQVFTGYNPSDQRSSLFGRLQRHFSEL